MPEQEGNRQVITTIGQRMTEAFTRTVGEEMARASQKGVPTETLLQEALKALLRMSAVVAGNLISPENAANSEQQARIDRLQIAFSQAVLRIMEGEIGALERKKTRLRAQRPRVGCNRPGAGSYLTLAGGAR